MKTFATSLICLLAATSWTHAENWPNWRGPHFNGSTTEQNLPVEFSTTENIAWSVDLPGAAAATPIVWEDRVFLAGVDAASDTLLASCYRRTDGQLLWQHEVAKGSRKDYRSNFASSSPVTDGKVVVYFYGNGDLVCYDLDGKQQWARNIQKDYGDFAFLWTFSSSPLLYDGKLYVQVLQRNVPVEGRGLAGQENKSYLLALDPQTGETVWRHFRPSQAVAESRESFSTPIPFVRQDTTQLLISGGDDLTAHDPKTGEELWRWGTWNPDRIPHWRLVPSPVVGQGIVLACAPKNDPIYAIRGDGQGRLDDGAVAWVSPRRSEVSADVPTPAFYDGDFFVLSDLRKALSRVEPQTGKVKWMIETPGRAKYEASPLAADGKIHLINFDGTVVIYNAADGELLKSISMDAPRDGEMVRASIAAAHGQLFIRTTRKLYCVGNSR
ncbi:MAG: PQQ-binding-like beta-propeller repeat protein [Pirellulaceae bacterium]|nr:PQQ-binding-like beta-propeller repeat protein [Pirellulaceae bacterium]